jgi:hypothetical protein
MFGTLRKLAGSIASVFRQRIPTATANHTVKHTARIPLRRGRPAPRMSVLDVTHLAAIKDRQRYPERTSARKTKGKRDASLKSRSNRRKAAR